MFIRLLNDFLRDLESRRAKRRNQEKYWSAIRYQHELDAVGAELTNISAGLPPPMKARDSDPQGDKYAAVRAARQRH